MLAIRDGLKLRERSRRSIQRGDAFQLLKAESAEWLISLHI